MSAIVFDKVWKEYGDHIVLEQIDLEISRAPSWSWSGPRDAASRPSCACCPQLNNPCNAYNPTPIDRPDNIPFGVTLIGPALSDGMLASIGDALH